jgi:hypothetical protein
MSNSLSPETIALLQQRGVIPPNAAPTADDLAAPPQAFGPPPPTWGADAASPALPPDIGAGNAPAGPTPMPPTPSPNAPDQKFDPSAIDALYAQGKLTPAQYASMGGTKPPPAAASPVGAPAAPRFLPNPNAGGPVGAPGAAPGAQSPDPFAPQYRSVPGHTVDTTSPGQARALEAAALAERSATARQGAAEVGANEGGADIADRTAARYAEDVRKRQEQETKWSAGLTRRDAEVQRFAHDLQASPKLDYDRAMNRKGPGGRVLSAIASAFGAFGAALTHTDNGAAKIIQDDIDRDIQEQQDELKRKQGNIEASRNSLGDYRQLVGDERAAKDLEESKKLKQYMMAGDAEVKRLQSPAIAAKWDTVKAQLRQRDAELDIKLHPWVGRQSVDVGALALERAKREEELYGARATTAEKLVGTEKTGAEIGKLNAETGKIGQGGARAVAPPPQYRGLGTAVSDAVHGMGEHDQANIENRGLLFKAYGKRGTEMANSLSYRNPALPGAAEYNRRVYNTLQRSLGGGAAEPPAPEITPEEP